MSYAWGAPLQGAVFALLAGDAALAALVEGVYDAPPPGAPTGTRVLIGEETAQDRGDASGAGAEHRLTVSVIGTGAGFLAAKQAAARITAVLTGARPELAGARVVAVWFHDAGARRLAGGQGRRIDLRFRIRLEGL